MADKATRTTSSLFDSAAFRGVLDSVPHPIFVKDAETNFLVVNEMMCRFMNRSFEELVGRSDYDFVPKEQADVFRGNDLRVLGTGEVNENEELFSNTDGELRTIVTRKNRLVLPDGTKLLVGCITDISDFRRVERLVRHNAEHDALTGLPNRRVFAAGMEALIAQSAATRTAFAFHLIDLDGFKPVNDIHGHTTGDAVLCVIAARLAKIVRTGDLICRLGGDEFAIVEAVDPGRRESPVPERALAERAIAAIEEPIAVGDKVVRISASIGIARCPADGTDLDTILRVADLALYRAKREGRATFRFFDESMQGDIRDQVRLENDLKEAVAEEKIVPNYQPLFALGRQDLIGFEMLARWTHPERGPVPPDMFIPLCEKLGLISELTFSLIERALEDARTWPANLILSVNLSALQLSDPLLPVKLTAALERGKFDPRRLELELTESAVIGDLAAAKRTLSQLQRIGIKIALDDFGVGYSGMYHLRELHVDKIKIDRSFVASMIEKPESAKIVNAILSLSQSLGLPTVAEGIEDAEAMRRMVKGGCQFGQGFYFSKAVSAAEAAALASRSVAGVRRRGGRTAAAG